MRFWLTNNLSIALQLQKIDQTNTDFSAVQLEDNKDLCYHNYDKNDQNRRYMRW